jgi:hypothetical protein
MKFLDLVFKSRTPAPVVPVPPAPFSIADPVGLLQETLPGVPKDVATLRAFWSFIHLRQPGLILQFTEQRTCCRLGVAGGNHPTLNGTDQHPNPQGPCPRSPTGGFSPPGPLGRCSRFAAPSSAAPHACVPQG